MFFFYFPVFFLIALYIPAFYSLLLSYNLKFISWFQKSIFSFDQTHFHENWCVMLIFHYKKSAIYRRTNTDGQIAVGNYDLATDLATDVEWEKY